jgi:fluoride ion exporter CrcB/FEX
MLFGEFIGRSVSNTVRQEQAFYPSADLVDEQQQAVQLDFQEEVTIVRDIPTTAEKSNFIWMFVNLAVIFTYILLIVLSWLLILTDEKSLEWKSAIWSLQLAPLGTLLRFQLARMLNKDIPESHDSQRFSFQHYCAGTFAANILGTLLFGLLAISQIRGHENNLIILLAKGASTGFCGKFDASDVSNLLRMPYNFIHIY